MIMPIPKYLGLYRYDNPSTQFRGSREYRNAVQAHYKDVDSLLLFIDNLQNPGMTMYREEVLQLVNDSVKYHCGYLLIKDHPGFSRQSYQNIPREDLEDYTKSCGITVEQAATVMQLADVYSEGIWAIQSLEMALYDYIAGFDIRPHFSVPPESKDIPEVFNEYWKAFWCLSDNLVEMFFGLLGDMTSDEAKKSAMNLLRGFRNDLLEGNPVDGTLHSIIQEARSNGLDEDDIRVLESSAEKAQNQEAILKLATDKAVRYNKDNNLKEIYDLPGFLSEIL